MGIDSQPQERLGSSIHALLHKIVWRRKSIGGRQQEAVVVCPGCQANLLQRECEADSFSWFMEALMQDLTLLLAIRGFQAN